MARRKMAPRMPEKPVRSVRIEESIWEKATRRARYENTTMSEVLYLFARGYAEGLINAPRRQIVYSASVSDTEVSQRVVQAG